MKRTKHGKARPDQKIKEVLSKVLRVVEESGTKCTPASPALPANDKNISLTNSVNCGTLTKQALLGMWVYMLRHSVVLQHSAE